MAHNRKGNHLIFIFCSTNRMILGIATMITFILIAVVITNPTTQRTIINCIIKLLSTSLSWIIVYPITILHLIIMFFAIIVT